MTLTWPTCLIANAVAKSLRIVLARYPRRNQTCAIIFCSNEPEGIIMSKVRRPIKPEDFTEIPRIREIIKALPKEIRVCSRHDKEVDIKLGELLPNQGPGVPF